MKLDNAEYVIEDKAGNRNIGRTRKARIFQFSAALAVMIAYATATS